MKIQFAYQRRDNLTGSVSSRTLGKCEIKMQQNFSVTKFLN